MTLSHKKVPFYRDFSPGYQKLLCHLMQNQLLSIDAELEKDRFKCLEMRELNDTEKSNIILGEILGEMSQSNLILGEIHKAFLSPSK